MRVQVGVLLALEFMCAVPHTAAGNGSPDIVIGQVYGRGGNLGPRCATTL